MSMVIGYAEHLLIKGHSVVITSFEIVELSCCGGVYSLYTTQHSADGSVISTYQRKRYVSEIVRLTWEDSKYLTSSHHVKSITHLSQNTTLYYITMVHALYQHRESTISINLYITYIQIFQFIKKY